MNRDDIINRKFHHAFWGYDAVEVDLFLDEVIRELDRLHNELDIVSLSAEAARQREDLLKKKIEKLQQTLGAAEDDDTEPDAPDAPDEPAEDGGDTDEEQ